MSEEGQRAESDVKTVAEILKSEGNDELKFGLLISLIKVNQASSKDVVNTVLHLLVGGEFEIETNFVIQDPQNILQMLTALEQCPDNLQVKFWGVFFGDVEEADVTQGPVRGWGSSKVMDLLLKAEEVVADLLVDLLGALAAYSITVKELRQLFRYLKADEGTWPRHSVKLISVLKQMPQRQGPDEFFSFPGKKGSPFDKCYIGGSSQRGRR
ncbi:neurobeachin-like [Ruditapes philippinarum]|uniref:neurobeachin-like n=1 Tax=Ruditapes philippinarum TaxID=129788 RepID=UPI00295AE385|nr:neurobeachin-like [Ruditapes philippinarum]